MYIIFYERDKDLHILTQTSNNQTLIDQTLDATFIYSREFDLARLIMADAFHINALSHKETSRNQTLAEGEGAASFALRPARLVFLFLTNSS
jgi:hypothetical protein